MLVLLDVRVAVPLERAVVEMGRGLARGGPEGTAVADEEEAGYFAGHEVAAFGGAAGGEHAVVRPGKVEFLDEGDEGCCARGAGDDAEV